MFLSFSESIRIIVDIDRNFSNSIAILMDLIDEFARIFHPTHSDRYLLDDRRSKHSIPIVCICECYSRYEWGKYPTSPENNSSNKWNIRICLFNKARSIDNISFWIFFVVFYEFSHIFYLVLTICIKSHEEFPFSREKFPTKEWESSLKGGSGSTIDRMTDDWDSISKMTLEEFRSTVSRSIINDKNLIKSRQNNTLNYRNYSSGFIVRSYEKEDIIFLCSHSVYFGEQAHEWAL